MDECPWKNKGKGKGNKSAAAAVQAPAAAASDANDFKTRMTKVASLLAPQPIAQVAAPQDWSNYPYDYEWEFPEGYYDATGGWNEWEGQFAVTPPPPAPEERPIKGIRKLCGFSRPKKTAAPKSAPRPLQIILKNAFSALTQ